jgi:alkylation response protein AidB-like acyl-CoA dehydrogenase
MHENIDVVEGAGQWDRARNFAVQEVAGSVALRDREARWDGALFGRLGAVGLLGAALPRAAGGEGLPVSMLSELLGGFGEGSGDAGLALAWTAHISGCAAPLWRLGTEAQQQRFMPALVRGDCVGALAHHERLASACATGVRTIAARKGGRWILNGRKSWVVNGPAAGLFVVTAVTDAERGRDGISAFLLERSTPGLSVGPRMATLGLRTATIAELVLEDCEVFDEALLGAAGTGLTGTCRVIHRWERACLFAPWVGFMKTLLDRSIMHVRERLRFGRPVSHSQAARAALADMKIRLEMSLRMQARGAWRLGQDDDAGDLDIAVGAMYLAASVGQVTREALQLHGLEGPEGDYLTERLYRDAALIAAIGGAVAVLRPVVAAALLGLG